MKKLISIAAVLGLLLNITSVFAVEYGGYDERVEFPYSDPTYYEQKGDFVYEKDTNKIYAYVGTSDEVVIPDNTVLRAEMFQRRKWKHILIKKLTIGKGVTYDKSTFQVYDTQKIDGQYCSEVMYIQEVTFAEGTTEIPDYAFYGAGNLTQINFPSTLKRIGSYAFAGDDEVKAPRITLLNLPDSVTTIGEHAFEGCKSVKEIHLPENLESIGSLAFNEIHVSKVRIPDKYLTRLPAPMVDADEYEFNGDMTPGIYKCLMNKDWIQEKYLKGLTDKSMGKYKDFVILDDVLLKYIGTDPHPVVPSEVKEICAQAFMETNVVTVELPEGILEIPRRAFFLSKLESITIPASVKKIGPTAFSDTPLKKLFIPKTVEEVQTGFAYRCPDLEEVTFEGAPKVGIAPFSACGRLKKENVHFLDDRIVLPEEFWEFLDVNPETPSPLPSATATATVKPTASPKPTETPSVTASPTASVVPTTKPLNKITVSADGAKIKVNINENTVNFPDAQPFVDENDRTQIPIRAIAETLDFDVSWDGETKTALLKKGNLTLTIQIGANTLKKNGETIVMDTVARVSEDRTYIPLRFIGEAFGYQVEWMN